MNYLDFFFIAIFALGAIKGYVRGFIVELFSFLAFFLGLFLAIELTVPLAQRVFAHSEHFQAMTILVFIVLFVIAVIIINLIAKVIKKVLDLTFLGFFDNVLGALAGIFKWAFILSVFFWVFDSIGLRLPQETADSSFFFGFVARIGPQTYNWVSNVLPFVHDMMDSLKNIGDKDVVV